MFAVIRTGGKQYKVAAEDIITVEKVAGTPGDIVEFGEVLMLGGDSTILGEPTVTGAMVAGEVVEQTRGNKVIAFKKRRRKNSRRKRGHRQELSVIRITAIHADGAEPARIADSESAPEPEVVPQVPSTEPEAVAQAAAAGPETAPDAAAPAPEGAAPAAKAKPKRAKKVAEK
jgi:large subunit ribosomal protein L21